MPRTNSKKSASAAPTRGARGWPPGAVEDFRRSGLDLEELARADLVIPLTPKDFPRYGLKANHDVAGGVLFRYATVRVNSPAQIELIPPERYCRAKLYYTERTGFAAALTKDPRPKYLQPPGTRVELYVPPFLDWSTFFADTAHPLIVTEGEKKALAAALSGLYCVALGGVNSFSNSRREEPLLAALAALAKGRRVLIVFDVDAGHTHLKLEVNRAALSLSAALVTAAEAIPSIVTLPADGSAKVGLDDWLLSAQRYTPDPLQDLVGFSLGDYSAQLLHEENERFVYVRLLDAVGDLKQRVLKNTRHYRTERNTEQVRLSELVTDKAGDKLGYRSVVRRRADAWLEWRGAARVERADYYPGRPEAIILEDDAFNTWRGWACTPVPDATERDVAPFISALQWLHGETDWQYMLDWYCYPLAFPGAKLFTLPVLQAEQEGVGKSVVPTMIAKYIYGLGILRGGVRNAVIVNSHTLNDGGRLEFVAETQFVVMDDMRDLAKVDTLLKAITTQESLMLNEKYLRARPVRNTINCVITTNRTNPLPVTELDRRFFYPHIATTKNEPLWRGFVEWFGAGGAGALLGWAANAWRRSRAPRFDPLAPAPMTPKKAEMVELSASFLDEWCRQFAERCAAGKANRELAKATEIMELYVLETGALRSVDEVSKILFARAMKLAGLERYPRSRVKIGATSAALYMLRRPEHWRRVEPKRLAVEFERARKLQVRP